MANPGYVETLVGNLPPEHRTAWKRVMDYVLRNLRFGPVVHQARTENLQVYGLSGKTSPVANQEFTVAHGLARIPYWVMPVLALDAVNSSLPTLTVTRAPDVNRIYLSSPSTSVAFSLWIE
jgi:hypothetical protein